MGEAMHALGIPTTRALAAVTTGEPVLRDRALPGAVLTRVAASHLRVGTFQFFAARGDTDKLRQLVDYALARHDPELAVDDRTRRWHCCDAVVERQAALIADWMNVGFIHGVMNTDNVAISGETIDFGPCAFIEGFDPGTVFSSIDEGGRYAYGNQPSIGKWNMARLAEALLPLIADDDDRAVRTRHRGARPVRRSIRALVGGRSSQARLDGRTRRRPRAATGWLDLLADQQVDFTLAWRRLADAAGGTRVAVASAVRQPTIRSTPGSTGGRDRIAPTTSADAERAAAAMRTANPIYIARNHLVEEALAAAVDDDDLEPFERLLEVVADPYAERLGDVRFADPAPPEFTAGYRTFCGT